MKNFQTIEFDAQTYERELNEFEQLLQNNHTLTEQNQILPFFRARPFLSSRIALLVPELFKIDKIAYEFDLFGDFCCDMVIGDSDNQAYCFIEFEDAQPTSIFTTQKTKFQSEFSYRLEHGYSQIIDWFYLLNHISPYQLEQRFDASKIDFHGVLIIGRNHFIQQPNLRNRLKWRSKNVVVDSKRVLVFTYDDLLNLLKYRLEYNIFK